MLLFELVKHHHYRHVCVTSMTLSSRMSVGFLRLVLSQALSRSPRRALSLVSLPLATKPSTFRPAWCCHTVPPRLCMTFSTDTESGGTDVADTQKETKKLDPRTRITFGSVGRKIGQRHIQLLGEDGEDLGPMHRAEVIRLMDQTGLKLVAINENSDPPLYRLMKGKQIREEQMKLRDAQKAKKGAFHSGNVLRIVFVNRRFMLNLTLHLFLVYLQGPSNQRSSISPQIFPFMI